MLVFLLVLLVSALVFGAFVLIGRVVVSPREAFDDADPGEPSRRKRRHPSWS